MIVVELPVCGAAFFRAGCGSHRLSDLDNFELADRMPDFIPVAKTSEIPDPGRKLVEIDDRLVVVVHTAGHFYAIDDVCTHDGGPLGEGPLEGFTLACPRHGAKFDVRDGRALTMPATKPTVVHEVKVVGGDVLVKLRD
jgi:3-phenylpropionate/trans-cinnamate dioxygenase ferredoxin subunit